MRKFTNPLDNVRIASPCSADWNEMYGSDRTRFCAACKLNVYNLSDMTRQEAENLLMNSEGRLCIRFFRRADGTVLTKNCPVGWQAVKKRTSAAITASFSVVAGFFGGVFGFRAAESAVTFMPLGDVPAIETPGIAMPPINAAPLRANGAVIDYLEVEGQVDLGEYRGEYRRSAGERYAPKTAVVSEYDARGR